ncbi:MAG: glutamate-cysteine ligase family protein [Armatimonadota bacterium]
MASSQSRVQGSVIYSLGLEEELFLTEPTRPHLSSLYYMSRLLLYNPYHYYRYSATNFARGADARECLMSAVEIATAPQPTPSDLLRELHQRRLELARAVNTAYIVPVGHLFDIESPTNTGGLHIHLSVPDSERERVYANLAYFLPLLILLSASSPYAGGRYFGQSYRVAHSFAIGPLQEDPTYRFQDLIFARRLGTIEIRALDPIWDWERLRWLLLCVEVIANLPVAYPLERERYAWLREQAAREGYTPALQQLYRELRPWIALPERLLQHTASDEIAEWVEWVGIEATYAALDHAYRFGELRRVALRPMKPSLWRGMVGFAGYYLLRLPYIAYKAWREWH